MYPPDLVRGVRRDGRKRRLHCFSQFGMKSCDSLIICCILFWMSKCSPRKFVDLPCMAQGNIRKGESNGPLGAGKRSHQKIAAQ